MQNKNYSVNKSHVISIIILVTVSLISYCFYSLNCHIKNIFLINEKTNTQIFTDIIKIPSSYILSKNEIKSYLIKSNYFNDNIPPDSEGKYYEDKDTLYIFRRKIKNLRYDIPAEIYKINFKKKKVTCLYEKSCNEFILEPIPIESSKNKKDKKQNRDINFIKKDLISTLILVEDKRFFQHFGLDFKSIIRASYINILNWDIVEGASTITQQLVKNLFLTRERSFIRKIKEAFLSIYIEFLYSKKEILEKYLNTVYLGQDKNTAIKGFPSASLFYFNKDINKLNLSESCMLVGMIKAPTSFSPIINFKKSLERKNLILKMLYDENKISKKTYIENLSKKITLNVNREYKTQDNYFYDAVVSNFSDKELNNISSIYTGLDPLFQQCAKDTIDTELPKIIKKFPYLKNVQVSMVTIQSNSGLIKAYIGGKDYNKSQFDRTKLSKRQLGSLIKPFVYLVALDNNLNNYKQATPISLLKDEPITLFDANKRAWSPQNFDKRFRGAVTLRFALENSLNVPTVYLSQKIGLKNIIKLLNDVGIQKLNEKNLALVLGAIDASLLDITSSYTTFSNEGYYIVPRFYSESYDLKNNILKQSDIKEKLVSNNDSIFILNTMLQGVLTRGTGKSSQNMGFHLQFGGKTGTSNDSRDNWFIGFNPQYVTGVWVGLDNNKTMSVTGAQTALPLWVHYTNCISKYIKNKTFEQPQNIERVLIDKTNLKKCDNSIIENEDNTNITYAQNDICYEEFFIKNKIERNTKNNKNNIKNIAKERNFFDRF